MGHLISYPPFGGVSLHHEPGETKGARKLTEPLPYRVGMSAGEASDLLSLEQLRRLDPVARARTLLGLRCPAL
jgi:hypothetical protein